MSETVIILQDDAVTLATGTRGKKPLVQSVRSMAIQSYADPIEQWKNAITDILEQLKPNQVRLVLPPAFSSSRVQQVPYVTGKQLEKLAKRTVSENFEEGIADYSVILSDRKNGVCLCCGGTEEDFLAPFLEIFKAAGVTDLRVTVPMESYLRVLTHTDIFKKKTAIFLLFEEGSVMSILCSNGNYLYSTRSRIFSEPGTLDFGTEIVRNISGILQFYTTRNAEQPITDVYFTGCAPEDFAVATDQIQTMNLSVSEFLPDITYGNALRSLPRWVDVAGAFISGGRPSYSINILSAISKKEDVPKTDLWKHVLVPAAVLVVCTVAYIGVLVMNMRVNSEINEIQEWIDDETTQSLYKQALSLEHYSQTLISDISMANQTTLNLSSYPEITDEMIRRIEDASGETISVRVSKYDASTGTLSYDAVSTEVIDIPGYVEKLMNIGLFLNVNYTGYQYDSEDEEYVLSLSCVLEGRTVKGDDGDEG